MSVADRDDGDDDRCHDLGNDDGDDDDDDDDDDDGGGDDNDGDDNDGDDNDGDDNDGDADDGWLWLRRRACACVNAAGTRTRAPRLRAWRRSKRTRPASPTRCSCWTPSSNARMLRTRYDSCMYYVSHAFGA